MDNGKCLAPSEGQSLINIINDQAADQLVKFPTRENRTLDLIITTLPGCISSINSVDKLSDHDIIGCSLSTYPCIKKKPCRKIYKFNKGNYEQMRSEAIQFAKDKYFNGHQNNRDVETNWNLLKSFLEESVDRNIPNKLSKNRDSLPWVSDKIRNLINKRNRTHSLAKKTGKTRIINKWKQLRSLIKTEIRQAHTEYVNNLIGDIKQDPKPFWKYLNSQKSDSQSIPPLKTSSGSMAETDLAKAQTFNEQFTSVFTHTKFEEVPYDRTKHPKSKEIEITTTGVKKLLNGLNTNKSCGQDNIHPIILKELANEIASTLRHIFQQSIDTGSVPSEWKVANICPIFKKKDRTVPANYRPVSLTCICCKMLEHIVCANLNDHFDKHNIITNRQHAFRKNHSCETQLSYVVNDWTKSLDNKQQVDVFILDFEKAFDTVPHELLKTKLNNYGVSTKTLLWIDAFLCGRKQKVVVNGTKSTIEEVVSGVPQGTVLGPLLFSVHINDIIKGISSEIRLFADDCVCYREINSIADSKKLQEDITTLGKWAKTWGMRFQPIKCNIMQIHRKRNHINYKYYLEGTELEILDSIKYLGVTITNNLTWNKHIQETCTKANRKLGLLRRDAFSSRRGYIPYMWKSYFP
jgi:hypothetical protein